MQGISSRSPSRSACCRWRQPGADTGREAASTFSFRQLSPALFSRRRELRQNRPPATTPEPAKPSDQEKPKNGWNTWENKAFATTLILTFGVDVAAFVQDDANTEQVGHQPTLVKWRAERINLVGQIKFKRPWTYQFGGNFNGLEADPGDRWTWMDARLDIPVPKVGRVKIGRQNRRRPRVGDGAHRLGLHGTQRVERVCAAAQRRGARGELRRRRPRGVVGRLVQRLVCQRQRLFGQRQPVHRAHQRAAGRRRREGRHRRPGRRQRVLQGSEERQAAVPGAGRRSTSPTTSPTPANSPPIMPSPRNSRRWPSRAAGRSSRMGR